MLYLVTFGSLIGYSAYLYALDKLPVPVVSIYSYINPVVAVLLGWLFYKEQIGMWELFAMLVIFAGVALVRRYGRKAPQPAAKAPAARANEEHTAV
jgi:drug/metabolite transporter (DMT)-like permease